MVYEFKAGFKVYQEEEAKSVIINEQSSNADTASSHIHDGPNQNGVESKKESTTLP